MKNISLKSMIIKAFIFEIITKIIIVNNTHILRLQIKTVNSRSNIKRPLATYKVVKPSRSGFGVLLEVVVEATVFSCLCTL